MANVGSLNVNLSLEAAQFISGMKRASEQSERTSRTIQNSIGLAKGVIGGFLAALSFDAFDGMIKKAFDYADAIQDVSDRTGASTKFIQEFGYAAQLSGSSVESSRAGLEKFSKTVGSAQNGNDAAAASLKKYGITSRDVDTATKQAADGISKLDTQSAKAAATAELFGKKNQNLTATMAMGSAGLSDMAAKANELGIVLDSGMIANAGKVNDQLDTLKMIVSAEMASAIVQNADAINSMATSMINLIEKLAHFWQQDPAKALAIMGAMAGGAVGGAIGGLPGAAIGAGVGAFAGYRAGAAVKNDYYRRNDKYAFVDDRYNAADAQMMELVRTNQRHTKTYDRLRVVRDKFGTERTRLSKGIDDGSITVGAFKTTGGYDRHNYHATGNVPLPKGEKAKKEHEDKEKDFYLQYLKELRQASGREIQARIANANNIGDRAGLERQLLDMEHEAAGEEIDEKQKKGKLNQEQADKLRGLADAEYASKLKTLGDHETDDLAKQKADLAKIDNDYQVQINGDQAQLAKSMAERRRLAQEAITLQFRQQRADQQLILDSATASDEEKAQAKKRMSHMDGAEAISRRVANKSTQGPLEAYLDQIPKTRDQMNEALESVEVEGLTKLQDGLAGALEGTKSLGEAFSDMATGIVDSLIKIAIQQEIVAPLAKALFGGGQSGGTGLLGSLVSGLSTTLTGHRANGGMTQPGEYEVGERGPEVVRIGSPASVMPNRALKATNDNAGATIHIGNIVSNDPGMVRMMVMEGVAHAMGVTTKQATDATLKKAGRRTL